MFDDIPVRVWLLILIALIAITPVRFVYRYVAHSPSRRDITRPAEDLGWRTPGKLARSLVILGLLGSLAIFIFTPTAEEFARSPRFWPLVLAGFGAYALFMVAKGIASGRTELLMRGFYGTYEREAHPKRYWASITWNILVAGVFFWAASVWTNRASVETLAGECMHWQGAELPDRQLAACDKWVYARPDDPNAYLHRGMLYLEFEGFDEAATDFTRAHELDPNNPWALANRGYAFASKNDQAKAEADFAVVRRSDRTNPVMLRGEALLRKNRGDLRGAVQRLTGSMERDPDNLWAVCMRRELYWDLGEQEHSIQDDQRWIQLRNHARNEGRLPPYFSASCG